MEHLLLGANQLIPRARDFQAEFEKNGAYSNAFTNVYDISYEAECADFEWERIIQLMFTAITLPLFLDDEFKAEVGNVREELTSRANNHFRHLSLALRKKYGLISKTDTERLKLLKNVNLKDIQIHYANTHTTSNMRFVISGNITPKRFKTIEQHLNAITLPKGNGRRELPDERPHKLDEALYIRNRTVDNLYFYIDTFMNRRLTDPESDALDLLNVMLTETLYSKILGTARERGLLYNMSSGYGQLKDAGNWWCGAQVSPENAKAVFSILIDELTKVINGKLSASDIDAAKAYSLGRFQRSAQTVGGIASGYANRYFFDDVIEDYFDIPRRIKSITKKAIVDISRNIFSDQTWGFGVLGGCGIDLVRELQGQLDIFWNDIHE
jgi:predicted Zn-dependent peptidase